MSIQTIQHAVVLGTGMMGPGIACRLACGGIPTILYSRSEEGARRGREAAFACLDQLEDHGLIEESTAGIAEDILHPSSDLGQAVRNADLVIESVPEDLPLKQTLFVELETLAPDRALLASNTSALSITAIAARCARPERVLATHFWNPPHLMPLVEIVCGARTSPDAAETVSALLSACGLNPVMVKKDRPGQLGNRLQMALVREAAHIVAAGIATAEDVDTAAKLGFGLRLPVYGILEHQDIVGLEMGYAVCEAASADLYREPHAPPVFREKIARGETGARAGRGFHDWSRRRPEQVIERRNRFLLALLTQGWLRDLPA